ncbi:SIR2 family protein (plasmid) [Priestia aryabhattai]|uniref:SIR2 family NAD-dependent protein deacylase n=1 Tax=Priestia aryabhattai TaxID=412384 RepID=UPI0025A46350|nr:SIR2 family protein [Priestia aryabhattai]WJN47500.1 SIR2 family protein [Priestia aryabhattai]
MFSDQHHIEKIRERLNKGNVSVMVGAGFSLNAMQLSKFKGSFLTWPRLVDGLKNKLYLDKEAKMYAPTDPLKLAEEFEFEFGREALEDFLKDSLPDNNYTPGELHKMLLSIPWVDIFTTNYDTLIERTRNFIYDKNYSLVQTVSDIPNSVRPRIVKLHGSFPSHRPFIFTEEDYRTYPSKFSPFVNLVQQSIMENTLCLIGFSGDDPNFKNWIGWVKDNLGDYASSIYFCGFLSESQKRNLESKNIRVIDFTKLFIGEKQSNYHEYALKWFFLELMKPKTRIPYYWPTLNENNPLDDWEVPMLVEEKLSYSQKDIKQKANILTHYDHDKGMYPPEILIKQSQQWREDRKNYPQWVVPPRNARNHIWQNTSYEIVRSIIGNKESLKFKEFLSIVYELIWRIEIGLLSLSIPRFSPLISIINEIVYEFANYIGDHKKITKHYGVQTQEINEIEQQCVKLCFSLVNYYREVFDKNKVYELLKLYKNIINDDEELLAEYYYQLCLLELNHLNFPKVKELLNDWPINYQVPYWQVRRTSILIELGEYEEAEIILTNSLNEIRKRNIDGNDIELLSQESWILRILNSINDRKNYSNLYNNIEKEEFVKVVNCDANRIYEEVVTAIDVDGSLVNQTKKPKVSFDPGVEIQTISFHSESELNYKNSIQLIKMVEKTGHRLFIKNIFFDKEIVLTACEFIMPTNFTLALMTLIQLRNKDYIKAVLTREIVATLDQIVIDNLFKYVFESLVYLNNQRSIKRLNVFYDTRFTNLIEILSRLTIRLTEEKLEKCLDLAIEVYLSVENENNAHCFASELNNLFRRVFYAFSNELIVSKLNNLLKLPLEVEEGFVVDPFHYLNTLNLVKDKELNIEEIFDFNLVNDLLINLKGATSNTRYNILLRLIILSRLGFLKENQRLEIGKILVNDGLSDTGFYLNSLISHFLFDEKLFREEIASQIKQMLSKDIVNIFGEENGEKFSYHSGKEIQVRNFFIEISYLLDNHSKCINFSYFKNSFYKLVDNLEVWWQRNKPYLTGEMHLERFPWIPYKRLLAQLLYTVSPDQVLSQKLVSIIADLNLLNLYTVSLLPIMVQKGQIDQEIAEKEFINYLYANDNSKVFDALEGLKNWIKLYKDGLFNSIPKNLINELIQKVFLERSPYLDQSLRVLRDFISYPLSLSQMEKILETLNNLYRKTELINFSQDTLSILKENDLLSIRASASQLAYAVYLKYKEDGVDIPETIELWKNESEKSTIPEIRKAWN